MSISLEENEVIIRKMFETINDRGLAWLDELMASNFVMHINAQQPQGWKTNRQFVEDELKAFPDLHVTIESIIAEGDMVCLHSRNSNTFR